MLSEVIKRRKAHVRKLQEMKNVMQDNENWEKLMPEVEAVIAGGMALQVLNDPVMLAKHLQEHCNSYESCEGRCPLYRKEDGCVIGSCLPEDWEIVK